MQQNEIECTENTCLGTSNFSNQNFGIEEDRSEFQRHVVTPFGIQK